MYIFLNTYHVCFDGADLGVVGILGLLRHRGNVCNRFVEILLQHTDLSRVVGSLHTQSYTIGAFVHLLQNPGFETCVAHKHSVAHKHPVPVGAWPPQKTDLKPRFLWEGILLFDLLALASFLTLSREL